MLWIILGDYGSGKTLKLVLEAFSSDCEVLGNFELDLDNYTLIEPMDLRKIGHKKLVVLDEMQTWLESRTSMSFLNRFITNIIDQTDKRDVDVFGTAHTLSSIDLRFRNNVHRIIRCDRIGKEPKNRTRKNDKRDFRYSTMNTYSGKITKKRLRYNKAKKYFPHYKTSEIIEYPNQKDLELDLLKKYDPTAFHKALMSIAQDIKVNGGLTHATTELRLLEMGYSDKHARLIYACFNELDKE